MTIFLTGGTGYIGNAVAEALRDAGHAVLALARSAASADRLEGQQLRVLRGDMTDPESLRRGAEQTDAVIHTATTNDATMPDVDAAAVKTILHTLVGTNKPFLYTSGTWVLGDTDDHPANEEAPTNATPLLAWRPALEQQILQAPNMRGVVIRPSMVYGRGEGFFRMMIENARKHGAARYIGSGENHWSFVHTDDLADLYLRALDAPAGTLLHATDGPPHRYREVAEAAAIAAGVEGHTISWPLQEARQRLGAFADALLLNQCISGERARHLLGWTPSAPSLLEDLTQGSYANT